MINIINRKIVSPFIRADSLIVPCLVFIYLFSFSIKYSSESIINSDSSFSLFKIINNRGFNAEAGRYSVILSQLPLVAAVKAAVPLKYLPLIYSVSFPLLYLFVYIILRSWSRNTGAANTLLIILVAGVSFSRFHPVSESNQGVAYSLFLAATLYHPDKGNHHHFNRYSKYLLSLLVTALCFFSHPITLFPLLFIILFFLSDQKNRRDLFPFLLFFIIVFIFILKAVFTHAGSYEGKLLNQARNLIDSKYIFTDLYPTRFILNRLTRLYLVHTTLFVCLMICYIYLKEFLKLTLILISVAGFLIVHNYIYAEGAADFALEKNFIVLSVIIGFPFMHDIYSSRMKHFLPVILFWILILYQNLDYSRKAAADYVKKQEYLCSVISGLQNLEARKFYISSDNININLTYFPWSFAVETLIKSSMEGPDRSLTVYAAGRDEDLSQYAGKKNNFMAAHFWLSWDYSMLNHQYFRLPEEEYTFLEKELK